MVMMVAMMEAKNDLSVVYEPGTGLGSRGPALCLEIGTVLGEHGEQLTDTTR